MVAYTFKKEFDMVAKVESGAKLHTIRFPRKYGHVKPGKKLQLYTGMMSKSCRKLQDDPQCWAVFPIAIDASRERIWINGSKLTPDQEWRLIKGDGFDKMEDFWEFFREPIEGLSLICWAEIEWLKVFLHTAEA